MVIILRLVAGAERYTDGSPTCIGGDGDNLARASDVDSSITIAAGGCGCDDSVGWAVARRKYGHGRSVGATLYESSDGNNAIFGFCVAWRWVASSIGGPTIPYLVNGGCTTHLCKIGPAGMRGGIEHGLDRVIGITTDAAC